MCLVGKGERRQKISTLMLSITDRGCFILNVISPCVFNLLCALTIARLASNFILFIDF